jgi:hypothetical protein
MDTSLVEIAGRIEGGRFTIAALGREMYVPASEVGTDESGDYALVDETEQGVSGGFKVRIEAEYDEELQIQSGGHIELFLEGKAHAKARADAEDALRRRGTGPDSAIESYDDHAFIPVHIYQQLQITESDGPWKPTPCITDLVNPGLCGAAISTTQWEAWQDSSC